MESIENLRNEIWKEVVFKGDFVNEIKIEVSNYGRVKSTTKLGSRLLKGSMVEGYKAIRLKFYKERTPSEQQILDTLKSNINKLEERILSLESENQSKVLKNQKYYENQSEIILLKEELPKLQQNYDKTYRELELKRVVNKGGLIHRFVAESFLEKPSPKHNLVAHIDFDKTNNRASNLKWMTRTENTEHQKNSPYVQASKKNRIFNPVRNENSKVCKLTSTEVMFIKKKILQGVPLRKLSKVFKVTETQLLRIKRGENWKDIPPAK